MNVKIIFGPPGTGKTTYLLDVLEKELRLVPPEEIAYVSFTKEGSYQGRDRAVEKFGYEKQSFPYFRTLHSLAFAQLKMSRSQVIDKRYYKMFSEKMGMKFTGYYTEDMRHNDDRYLFFNILHRNNPRAASQYLFGLDTERLRLVSKNYRTFKSHYSIFDFTDMIELFIKDRHSVPVKVAIIDEAQDLTTLQWRMVWTAFRNCEKAYIAGDDDQAIYEWSGADVNYFLNISGEIEILRRSFRLPENIVDFVNRITGCILQRITKEYHGLKQHGTITRIMDIRELSIDDENETWMFLSRNHVFLKDVVQHIRNLGLVYSYNGVISAGPRNMDMIHLFEKVRQKGEMDIHDEIKLRPYLKRRIDLTKPWYYNFNWKEDELVYYRDLVRTKANLSKCNIRINTIHSVKGAEADNVVLLMDITRQIKNNFNRNADSEYRVLYVGCTRVKRNLFMVESHSKYEYILPTRAWIHEA